MNKKLLHACMVVALLCTSTTPIFARQWRPYRSTLQWAGGIFSTLVAAAVFYTNLEQKSVNSVHKKGNMTVTTVRNYVTLADAAWSVLYSLIGAGITTGMFTGLSYCFDLTVEAKMETINKKVAQLQNDLLLAPVNTMQMLDNAVARFPLVSGPLTLIYAKKELETIKSMLVAYADIIEDFGASMGDDQSIQEQCNAAVATVTTLLSYALHNSKIVDLLLMSYA